MAGIFETWQVAGVTAVLVGFFIVAVAFMLSYLFNLSKLRGWARNEFYQSVANAMIIGAIIILFSSINGLVNTIISPTASPCSMPVECDASKYPYACQTNSPGYAASFDHAKCFLKDGMVRMLTIYGTVLGINMAIGIPLSLQLILAPFQQGWGIAPTQGLTPVSDLLGMINIFAGGAYGLLYINSFLLDFIRFKLVVVLPVGLVLRAFPFTRGAGAALISLFVGLYVVYPILFAIDAQIYWKDISNFGETACSAGQCVPPLSLGSLASWLTGGFGNYLDSVAYTIFIVGFVLPVFNLTITFAFMKDFSRLLGGEIDVSGLMKLI